MKTIAIFGSTGMTGLAALEAAINKGLSVRVLVRNPEKVPDTLRKSIEIIEGDVLNYDDVNKTVQNVDAVVSVLGTGNDLSPTTVMSEGMKNITRAMLENNVEVIASCFSAFLFYEVDKVPPRFKEVNADHQREYDVLKVSGLKHIAVFPPHITQEAKSEYSITHNSSPGRLVSKYELGEFLVESLFKPEHYDKICGIASKPKV